MSSHDRALAGRQGVGRRLDRPSPVYNPATGEVARQVALASAEDVDAVAAAANRGGGSVARQADPGPVRVPRARPEHQEDLARLITAEHGKVFSDALGEVGRGLEVVEFACGIPHLLKGGYSEGVSTGVDVYSIRQPVGVVAGITPFNFPAMVPMWMFPVAIACGNAFVLKPTENDPSASLLLAELWAEAGLPDGVFSVVHGDKEAVDALLDHPDVRAVSFVGSTPIARYVYESGPPPASGSRPSAGPRTTWSCCPTPTSTPAADAAVSRRLRLGRRAVHGHLGGRGGRSGRRRPRRPDRRADRRPEGRRAPTSTDMGPVVTAAHRDKVAGYVDAGADAGATLVVDGRALPGSAVRGTASCSAPPCSTT